MEEIKKILKRMHRVETKFSKSPENSAKARRLLKTYQSLYDKLRARVSMYPRANTVHLDEMCGNLIKWMQERRTMRTGRKIQKVF